MTLQGDEVLEGVQPLGPGAASVADRGRHQLRPGPIVELPVADADDPADVGDPETLFAHHVPSAHDNSVITTVSPERMPGSNYVSTEAGRSSLRPGSSSSRGRSMKRQYPEPRHRPREGHPPMTRNRSALTKIALVAVLVTGSPRSHLRLSASTLTPRARMYHATNNSRLNNESTAWTSTGRCRGSLAGTASRWRTGATIFHTANPSAFYLDGVDWSTWGENVGVTGGTVASIQTAFMQSTGHRANILNQRFRRVGTRHLSRRRRPALGDRLLLRLIVTRARPVGARCLRV